MSRQQRVNLSLFTIRTWIITGDLTLERLATSALAALDERGVLRGIRCFCRRMRRVLSCTVQLRLAQTLPSLYLI